MPGGVAAFTWASTLSVTSYWAHLGALASFPALELVWMALSPVAMVCLVVGAAKTVRRVDLPPRTLRYEACLARVSVCGMSAFLVGSCVWVIDGGPGPKNLFHTGAIDIAALVMMGRGRGCCLPSSTTSPPWRTCPQPALSPISMRDQRRTRTSEAVTDYQSVTHPGVRTKAQPATRARMRSWRYRGCRGRRRHRHRTGLARDPPWKGGARRTRRSVFGAQPAADLFALGSLDLTAPSTPRLAGESSATRSPTRPSHRPGSDTAAGGHAARLRRQPHQRPGRHVARAGSGAPIDREPLAPMAMVTVDGGNGYWNPHPGDNPMAMVIDEFIPLCQRLGLGRHRSGSAQWASRWAATAPCCWPRNTRISSMRWRRSAPPSGPATPQAQGGQPRRLRLGGRLRRRQRRHARRRA